MKQIPLPMGSLAAEIITSVAPLLDYTNGPWIAGGVLRRLIVGDFNDDHDIDVFFRDEEQRETMAPLFREREKVFKSDKVRWDWAKEPTVGLMFARSASHPPIQLIPQRCFQTPEGLLDDFDFTVCQLVSDGVTIRMTDDCERDLAAKALRLVHGTSKIKATHRIARYFTYGYEPDDEVLALAENLCIKSYYDPTGAQFEAFEPLINALPDMDHTDSMMLSHIGGLVFDRHPLGMIAYVGGAPYPANMAFLFLFGGHSKQFVTQKMRDAWAKIPGCEKRAVDPPMTPKTFFDAYRAAL